MIMAYKDGHGTRVVINRSGEIMADMEELAAVIASFRTAMYREVPTEVADMIITTVGRMAYAYDDENHVDEKALMDAMNDLHEFMDKANARLDELIDNMAGDEA